MSNNLEAIELLQSLMKSPLITGHYIKLNKVISLLQADEVQEWCAGCAIHKKPTKETKLKAIKERLQLMDSPRPEVLYLRDEVVRITNVLLEEEY